MKKFVLTLTALSAFTLSAFTLSAANRSYHVSIQQDSVVEGKEVKAGDYKLQMKDSNTAILKHGKETIEVPAREETAPQKFATTEMEYTDKNLRAIDIGSTATKIVFSGATAADQGNQ